MMDLVTIIVDLDQMHRMFFRDRFRVLGVH
jgi:hypothetical protein